MSAQYLGLSPVEHADLMFLIDAMLTPELPCGWLRRASPGLAEGDEFFWNALLGGAQWEHPQISLLTGVANDLKQRQKEHERTVEMRVATAEKLGHTEGTHGEWHGARHAPHAPHVERPLARHL